MYTSLILSLNLAINLSPTLYHSLPLCNYSLNVCASSHSLLSPNPPTLSLSLSIFLNLLVLSLTIYISHFCYGPLAFYMYVILSTTLFQKALHIFTYISILLIYVYCIVYIFCSIKCAYVRDSIYEKIMRFTIFIPFLKSCSTIIYFIENL